MIRSEDITNGEVIFCANYDSRYESLLVIRKADKYYMLTATNSRKFNITETTKRYVEENFTGVLS